VRHAKQILITEGVLYAAVSWKALWGVREPVYNDDTHLYKGLISALHRGHTGFAASHFKMKLGVNTAEVAGLALRAELALP
jgi:hypothetical protein